MAKSKKKSSITLEDHARDFYCYLGLLSVRFATMENLLLHMVSKLSGNNDDIAAFTLLENNNLHQNLELAKKLNRLRNFHADYITRLLEKIASVKKIRNSFIHGVWSSPVEKDNDIVALCIVDRVQFSEEVHQSGKPIRTWQRGSYKEFGLDFITEQIKVLDDVIFTQHTLLEKMQDHDFD
jgi:hypothetical protein